MSVAQISARAKQIRKRHPGKKWQTCIKEAAKELKGKPHKAARKKAGKPVAKSSPRKTKTRAVHVGTGVRAGASAAQLKAQLRDRVKEQLGKALLHHSLATTKTLKRKHAKECAKLKAELKRYQ